GEGLATDGQGGVYLFGVFGGLTVTSLPLGIIATPGAYREQPPYTWDYSVYLVKFNEDGVRQWGTFYGADSCYTLAYDLKCSVDGSVYLMGIVQPYLLDSASTTVISAQIATPCSHEPEMFNWCGNSFGPPYHPWLAAFTPAGQRKWGTFFGGLSVPNPSAISTDAFGHIYLTGTAENSNATLAYCPGAFSEGTEVATLDGHQPVFLGDPDTAQYGIAWNAFLVQFLDTQTPDVGLVGACGPELATDLPAQAYQWIDCTTEQPITGATSPTFTAPGEGSYAVILDNGTCGMDTSACVQVVNAAPVSIDVQAISGCGGLGSVVTHVTSGGPGPFTYTWDPAVSAVATADDLQNGLYTVTVFDAATCTNATATV
ncbi:MAG TPA: hypothetical protein PK760_15270, partial [Flavobacteriales bacterium]|nr:hypothetical protein [Flavobacteriales bacterium]